jgi:hypothetical protein
MKTYGISPKLIAAVISAVVAHLLAQTLLELDPGVVLALQVIAVAAATWAASPGNVAPKAPASDDLLMADHDTRHQLQDH